jgi:hypothetical protein
VDYEQFDGEFRRVLDAVTEGVEDRELRVRVGELRGMAEAIADAEDRKSAGFDIQMLEDILDSPPAAPVSEVMQAVNAAYRLAVQYDGTPAERVGRVERGIEELSRLAQGADEDDRDQIYGLSESLYMLLSALRGAGL